MFLKILTLLFITAPVLPEKPQKESIDWKYLWKQANTPKIAVGVTLVDIVNNNSKDAIFGIFFVDGKTEINLGWASWFPINQKKMSISVPLSPILMSLERPPSKKAKIVVRDGDGKEMVFGKLELIIKEIPAPGVLPLPKEKNE